MVAKATPKVPRPKEDITPFKQVMKTINDLGWIAELGLSKDGWCLDIYSGDELVARGRSKRAPPDCFRHLGRQIERALQRFGKA